MNLCVFSKHLLGPTLEETARRLRAMGLDALDLTVRPGGHVEPDRVEEDLPRAHQILADAGVRIAMITTNITDANDPTTTNILRTASSLGISHYKLGYYNYKGFGTLRRQREEVRGQLQDLAALNSQFNIVAGFHNHSHNFLGASLHDIEYLLQPIDPKYMGLYLDPAHASIEGGSSGWIQGLDLLAERVVMMAVKDYYWVEGHGYGGGRRYHVVFAPLQDGNVPWPEVLKYLKQINFNGPVSLHSEYQGSHSFRDLSTDEVFDQTAIDHEVFKGWINEVWND